MATRGKNTEQGFIITENSELDVSGINQSIRKVLSAIRSILTLGWIPSNEDMDPHKLELEDVKQAQLANRNNTANTAQFYNRRF